MTNTTNSSATSGEELDQIVARNEEQYHRELLGSSYAMFPTAATNREVTPLSQVIQTEVEKWENRLTDAETALHNIEAARQRQAVTEAILMSQVANWTKERDRLQDLIDTATKSS